MSKNFFSKIAEVKTNARKPRYSYTVLTGRTPKNGVT
jgi:hypothetical protein